MPAYPRSASEPSVAVFRADEVAETDDCGSAVHSHEVIDEVAAFENTSDEVVFVRYDERFVEYYVVPRVCNRSEFLLVQNFFVCVLCSASAPYCDV